MNKDLRTENNMLSMPASERLSAIYWDIRKEVLAVVEVGVKVGIAASFVSIAGLMNWCGYCGGWHGGPPPRRSEHELEAEPAPPVPEVLKKAIRAEVDIEHTWQEGGQVDGEQAKVKQSGERVEALWGGDPDPDSDNHAHIISKDGLNAIYVRDLNEHVIVDDSKEEPYQTYTRDTAGRYSFE